MSGVRTTLLFLSLLVGLVGSGEARQAKTLAEITSTGSVTACADPDNLPFTSSDAQWPGYDVEVIRAVAAELGARAEFKWIGTRSARAAMRNLLEGECDLFPGLPVAPGFTEEYPQLAFSRAYYTMRHVVVVGTGRPLTGLADLRGLVTAVEALSAGDLFLLQRGYPRRSYRTQEAAFRAVQSGETPAALLWAPLAGWFLTRSSAVHLRLVPVSDPDLAVAFGVAFLKRDPALKHALDRAIERLEARGAIEGSLRRYGVPVGRAGARPGPSIEPARWVAAGNPLVTPVAEVRSVPPDFEEGRTIFQENCAECHRSDGRGGGSVPRLQQYPFGAEKRFIETVLNGRNSVGMPPWGGLLTEAQVRSVLAYVRVLVPTLDIPAGATPAAQARLIFGQICVTCHGREGAGTRLAPSLQAFRGTDEEFVRAVLDGRPGTAMAPFKSLVSVEMAQQIRQYVRDLGRLN